MTIKLTNNLTRRKEVFEPIDANNVRMYVCGPTVYDRAHLGNARPVVVFDVLNRLLRHTYGEDNVTYVRNFTDVDDKINARAAETGRNIRDITDETIDWFHEDMDALGALRPDHEPRATEYIPQMVSMIEELIAKDMAYAAEGHVLFRVRSYKDYGALSGRSVDDMIAGARVEVAPFKEDAMDFVLWKPSDDATPGWDSPWGKGRPGWHIECSAMARDLLGAEFDIHAGGLDLQFPHHENEIAQSCACGDKFARVWMHNEMLQVEGKKMSKSLGNFFTVRELLDQGWAGEVIRFVMLSTHYSKPMDWTEKKAGEAQLILDKWYIALHSNGFHGPHHKQLYQEHGIWTVDEALIDLLSNDLNTPGVLSRLHSMFNETIQGSPQTYASFAASMEFLGLVPSGFDLAGSLDVGKFDFSAIEKYFSEVRQRALETKDFAEIDKLKEQLVLAGVEVKMDKNGASFHGNRNFDPAKLEGLL